MVSVGAFMLFNWPKASIFMGDTGSIFLGYIFGSFILITVVKNEICLDMASSSVIFCRYYSHPNS